MTIFTNITSSELVTVSGGRRGGTPGGSQCDLGQFEWMKAHMVADGSTRPGVWRHVVVADAKACGFPMK